MKKFCLFFLMIIMLFSKLAVAAEESALSLSPPFVDVEMADNELVEFEVEIGNNSDFDQSFELSVLDFGSLDESGGVAFLTANPDKSERKYALASWISLEKSEMTVAAKAKQKIKITILNKESLSPGGHYGAVLATLRNGDKLEGDRVGISQSMASLLYVQKNGGEIKNLILKNVLWKNPRFKLIDEVTLRFENDGNTHLVPRGKIEIKNSFGKLVAKGIINEASAKILPESFRKMEVKVKGFVWWKWPGKYKVEIDYRFDGRENFSNYKNSFVYIGIEGVILVFLVILVIMYFWRKNRQ